MSSPDNALSERRALVQGYLENDLNRQECRRLLALLQADASLADEILAGLRDETLVRECVRETLEQEGVRPSGPRLTRHAGGRFQAARRAPLAAAAALLAALGIGLWLSRTGTETPTPHGVVARVESVQGSVFSVQDADPQRRALEAGDEIREGMRIETEAEGAVTLAWVAEATSVEMTGNSKLETRNSKQAFLHQGQLTATVAPQPSDRPFAVETRRASARVVGTRFELEARPELTKLTVREGAVDFTEQFSDTTVRVSAGEYAVAIPGAPLAPTPIGTPLPVEYRWDFSEPADPDLFKVFRGQWRHVPPSESEYGGGLGYMEMEGDLLAALILAPVHRFPVAITFDTIGAIRVDDAVETVGSLLVAPLRAGPAVMYETFFIEPPNRFPAGTHTVRKRHRIYVARNGSDMVVDLWDAYLDAPDRQILFRRRGTHIYTRTDPGPRLSLAAMDNIRLLSLDIRSVVPDKVPDTSAFRKLTELIPRERRSGEVSPPDTPPFRELNVRGIFFHPSWDTGLPAGN